MKTIIRAARSIAAFAVLVLACSPVYAQGVPTLSIGDVEITEGNSSTKLVTFTVALSAPQSGPVFFDAATADGTALAGTDYVAKATAGMRMAAGVTSKSFSVSIVGDTSTESDESFFVRLSNPVGATIADGEAVGTILNDDVALPFITIGNLSISEGNSGTKNANFTVSLSAPSATTVSFDVATADFSAFAGEDYVALNQTGLTIPAGNTSKVVSVQIKGDTTFEPDEAFTLNITGATGANWIYGSAKCDILNDDAAPNPALSIADVSVSEGAFGTWTAFFRVTLSEAPAQPVTFDVSTSDGTAVAGSDYVALTSEHYTINPGQAYTDVLVTFNGDMEIEADETFNVVVSNIVGGTIADGTAVGTITNDDAEGGPTMSIGDVSVVEGNSGQKYAEFELHLSAPSATDVKFTAATADGTATAGSDYIAQNTGEVTILPGSTVVGLSVPIIGDTVAEADETFTISLSNVVGAQVPDPVATGTITNDDGAITPMLSIGDVSIAEGDSGTKLATFTVALSVAQPGAVTFNIATANGTATAGSDYVAKSTTGVSIPAGSTSKTFTVTINGDTTQEANETFFVNLSSASGATIADGQAVGTISNDDVPSLSIADATTAEGNATSHSVNFVITLSAPNVNPIGFDVATADGTAHGSGLYQDYTPVSAHFVIPANSSSYSVPVSVFGDTQLESDETFTVSLSNVTGATATDSQATGTIGNDDVQPTIQISGATVVEGNSGQKSVEVMLQTSDVSEQDVTFNVATADGSAKAGQDYVALSGSGKISAGERIATVSMQVNGDTTPEIDEAFTVSLSNVIGATILQGTGTVTITNDDGEPPVTISIADGTILEQYPGSPGMAAVTLSKASATRVTFDIATANGTALAGSDYVAKSQAGLSFAPGETLVWVSVSGLNDAIDEPNETFTLNLSNVSGAVVGDAQALFTIQDDDEPPFLSINDATFAEGNSGDHVEPVLVTLSSPSLADVTFSVSTSDGTATAGSDYVAVDSAAYTIPAGNTSVMVLVTVSGDGTIEPNETLNLTLGNVAGANVGDGSAVATISDDDAPVGPTLSIGNVAVTEGSAGTSLATFTVTLSAAQTGPVNFDLATADGTATAGSDYVAKSNPGMRIPAGSSSKTFAVTINGDTTQESFETFFVNLTNPVGATIAHGQAMGTIIDDDGAGTPTLSIADASVSEGNSGTKVLTFTVNLSPSASVPVTYNIATSNGTATSGSDYVASSLTGETIAAWTTSKTFAVTISGDTTTEANETFNVTLSNVSGATLGDGSAVGTITNDDGGGGTPTLTIADVSMAEGNSLSKQMTFTVKLSAAATGPVTYSIATANGTALSPGDYTAKSLTGQSIAAGTTSKTFTVAVKGDTVAEPNETFKVNVTGVTGATLGDGQAIGTITNDDAARMSIARFDAGDLVDDVDDGHREPRLTTKEYATLLADGANAMCRRAPNATVIAVDRVENRQVLTDLAAAANALCASKPSYNAVMADSDSRGFLIAAAAKDEADTTVLGKPEASVGSTTVSLLVPGHAQSVTVVLASGSARELARQLRLRAKAQPTEALVLLGANPVGGLVDLTARSQAKPGTPLPKERILVNAALLELYRQSSVGVVPLPADEAPAQMLELR